MLKKEHMVAVVERPRRLSALDMRLLHLVQTRNEKDRRKGITGSDSNCVLQVVLLSSMHATSAGKRCSDACDCC